MFGVRVISSRRFKIMSDESLKKEKETKKIYILQSRASKIIIELIGFVCVVALIILSVARLIKDNYFEKETIYGDQEYAETDHVKYTMSHSADQLLETYFRSEKYYNVDRYAKKLMVFDISDSFANDILGKEDEPMYNISYISSQVERFSINDVEQTSTYEENIDNVIYELNYENTYDYEQLGATFDIAHGSSQYIKIRSRDYRKLFMTLGSTGVKVDEIDNLDNLDISFSDWVLRNESSGYYAVMTSSYIYNVWGMTDIKNLYDNEYIYIPLDYLSIGGSNAEFEESILYAPFYSSLLYPLFGAMGEDYNIIRDYTYYARHDTSLLDDSLMYTYTISGSNYYDGISDNNVYMFMNDDFIYSDFSKESIVQFIKNNCDIVVELNINNDGLDGETSYYVDRKGKKHAISYLSNLNIDYYRDTYDTNLRSNMVFGLKTKGKSNFYNNKEIKKRAFYDFCKWAYPDYDTNITVFTIILACLLLILLLIARPFREKDAVDEGSIFYFDKMLIEIPIAVFVILALVMYNIGIETYRDIFIYDSWNDNINSVTIMTTVFVIAFFYIFGVEILLSIVRRIRRRVIIKELIVLRLISFVSSMFEMASRQGRGGRVAFIRGGAVVLFNIAGLIFTQTTKLSFKYVMLVDAIFIIINMMSLYKTVKNEEGVDRVLNTAREIGGGNLDAKVNTEGISGSSLTLAWTINGMNEALSKSVEKNVRDEKMKAELITNVSHDIKTPLTSIINYVSLIRREDFDNEKVLGYLDILDNKSQRLKQLIEDLIEASKASSGEIEMDIVQIDFSEFLYQMEGEYIDKFNEKGIELVTNICEEPVMINADGRHLFRITENVLTNAFKYSKENTKVNMTLTYDEDNAIMTLENVCAQKIEVSEDELIERFVRGDRSRSTEGSGLGLSISKSLTELMNGEFLIEVTGEMFKVILKFPLIKKNTEGQNDE